jgi:hypothetical protein
VIAATAALFSITGIATAFSGHFLQVAIMAGAIEAGKIVVASVLYRYWKTMAWIHKSYLTLALIVLMVITSIGIFGYLSEAYQTNRADFVVNEKRANILESKKTFFIDRKDRLKADKELELRTKVSNQTRADSLSSRGQSITRTRVDIKESETKIVQLEQQISAMEDSIGSYDLQIINLQSKNEKSELGPLTYIASALNMNMDDVVKWFILILVFVFDPLAVALIVAANMIYLKKTGTEHHDEQPEFTEHFINKAKALNTLLKKDINKEIDPEIAKHLNDFTKISSEDIKPEISKMVDDHFDKLLEKPKINVSESISDDIGKIVKEGAEIIKKEKKEPIFRRWKSANWREPEE